MNPAEYDRMFSLEDEYWWFVGRRNLALRLLGTPSSKAVLDLGCGTGAVLSELRRSLSPVGVDMSQQALAYCRQRGADQVLLARGEHLPLCSSSFSATVALDIFEHIDEDVLALKECFRVLEPGGVLILSVPALRGLWGPHDEALMHFRRYTAREVRKKLENAGFEIHRLSYSVFFLFPIVAIIRFFEKRRKGPAKASLPALPGWANRSLIWLQNCEAAIIQRCPLPWGSSVIAVARKPVSVQTAT